jgi:hypothetical protein
MKKAASSPKRWFAGLRGRVSARPAANPADDPADFGTAFGLDLSLPSEATGAPAAPAAPGWRTRWALRRRTA